MPIASNGIKQVQKYPNQGSSFKKQGYSFVVNKLPTIFKSAINPSPHETVFAAVLTIIYCIRTKRN